jgi:hypothetical protein
MRSTSSDESGTSTTGRLKSGIQRVGINLISHYLSVEALYLSITAEIWCVHFSLEFWYVEQSSQENKHSNTSANNS